MATTSGKGKDKTVFDVNGMDVDRAEFSIRVTKSTKLKPTTSEKPKQPTGSGSGGKQSNSRERRVTSKQRRASTPEEVWDGDEDKIEQIDPDKLHYSVVLESDNVHVSDFCILNCNLQ